MLGVSNWDSKRAPGMNIESLLSALNKRRCIKSACEDYLWRPSRLGDTKPFCSLKQKYFVVLARSPRSVFRLKFEDSSTNGRRRDRVRNGSPLAVECACGG